MVGKLREIIVNARYRASAYGELIGWVVRLAFRGFAISIVISVAATATSIFCQGLSLAMVVGAVSQLQEHGHLVSFPGLSKLGLDLPPPSSSGFIVLFVLVFLLGSALAYVGRHRAIRLESDLYRFNYHALTEFFTRDTETSPALFKILWMRRTVARTQPIMRIILGDARFAGVVTRLGLFNVTHVGNIIVGIVIIGLFAPVLLPLIALFALISTAFMYPLNLRASKSTRLLEEEAARRSRVVRDKVAFLITNKDHAALALDDQSDEELGGFGENEAIAPDPALASPETPDEETASSAEGPTHEEVEEPEPDEKQIIDGFLHLAESRLLILETSRILMSSMVGIGIGFLVWLMFSDSHEGVISYSSLLVLFFGLRFVMNGIEGAMVTMTSINRFLPNLLRLRELIRKLEDLGAWDGAPTSLGAARRGKVTRPGTALEPTVPPPPDLPRAPALRRDLDWNIDTLGLQRLNWTFSAGEVYAMLVPAAPRVTPSEQVRRLLARHDVDVCEPDIAPADRATTAPWVDAVLAGDGLADCGEGDTAADATALRDYLSGCLRLAHQPAPVVVLSSAALAQLSAAGMLAVARLFPGSTVIFHSSSLQDLRARVPSGELLVGDSDQVCCLIDGVTIRPQARDFLAAICAGQWREGRQVYENAAGSLDVIVTKK